MKKLVSLIGATVTFAADVIRLVAWNASVALWIDVCTQALKQSMLSAGLAVKYTYTFEAYDRFGDFKWSATVEL